MDVDDGVTPFMLGCRASGSEFDCDGMAESSLYRIPLNTPEHGWEWFSPKGMEYRKLSPRMREHVDKGGLDLRKVRASVYKDPAGYIRDSHGSLRRVAGSAE